MSNRSGVGGGSACVMDVPTRRKILSPSRHGRSSSGSGVTCNNVGLAHKTTQVVNDLLSGEGVKNIRGKILEAIRADRPVRRDLLDQASCAVHQHDRERFEEAIEEWNFSLSPATAYPST